MSDFDLDILIEEQQWRESIENIEAVAKGAVHAAAAYLRASALPATSFSEVSVALVDDAKIQDLNAQYRGKDRPTNVLSFPGVEINGETPMLGDIVLALETVIKESSERLLKLENHVTHLLVHGFLHLHGFDHENEVDATKMEAIEVAILQGLGIADPYDKGEEL